MSTVWFAPAVAGEPAEQIAEKIGRLWRAAGFDEVFRPGDLSALKLHVGEPGTRTYVDPAIVAALVARMKETGARPFLTDTAVLYKSLRADAVGHAQVAREHGFGEDQVGAPFLPADGLIGADEIEVEVGGRHFDKVAIATGILQARSVLVLSHATGHIIAGMGATLKNLGMGCASRKGKLRQHHGHQPSIDEERCIACGLCARWCPESAITVGEVAHIDAARCIGCGECVAVCRDDAVTFGWDIVGDELQERMVEHAAGVVRSKAGRIAYVTVAVNITKDCDCMGQPQTPAVPDLGLLASHDPVALDAAVLALVRERTGRSLESQTYPRFDANVQVRYAEEMGLGQSDFTLVGV